MFRCGVGLKDGSGIGVGFCGEWGGSKFLEFGIEDRVLFFLLVLRRLWLGIFRGDFFWFLFFFLESCVFYVWGIIRV